MQTTSVLPGSPAGQRRSRQLSCVHSAKGRQRSRGSNHLGSKAWNPSSAQCGSAALNKRVHLPEPVFPPIKHHRQPVPRPPPESHTDYMRQRCWMTDLSTPPQTLVASIDASFLGQQVYPCPHSPPKVRWVQRFEVQRLKKELSPNWVGQIKELYHRETWEEWAAGGRGLDPSRMEARQGLGLGTRAHFSPGRFGITTRPPLHVQRGRRESVHMWARSLQSCLTLCDLTNCRLASLLSVVFSRRKYWNEFAISSSRGSSWPRDQTHVSCVSCITGRCSKGWATREAQNNMLLLPK